MLDLINDKRLEARKAKYDEKLKEIRKVNYIAEANNEALKAIQLAKVRKSIAKVLAERLAK